MEAGDEAMHIGLWAARKRKATWPLNLAGQISSRDSKVCNARMISRSQLEHIANRV